MAGVNQDLVLLVVPFTVSGSTETSSPVVVPFAADIVRADASVTVAQAAALDLDLQVGGASILNAAPNGSAVTLNIASGQTKAAELSVVSGLDFASSTPAGLGNDETAVVSPPNAGSGQWVNGVFAYNTAAAGIDVIGGTVPADVPVGSLAAGDVLEVAVPVGTAASGNVSLLLARK